MIALFCLFLALSASPFKSKNRLAAENAALRHQLIVVQRRVRGRIQITNGDRLFLVMLYRWFPSVLKTIAIIRPETLVRWHRAGFRRYWRWKSRSLGGRPQVDADLRALIRRMSADNPLWGAPRIHGELLKLGFEIAQSSVAKYMVKRSWPPSQGWRTFLRNHSPDIAAMDLFVTPTLGFHLLYAYNSRNEIVGTTNKSIDAMPSVWLRRKVFQPCDGGRLLFAMYFATVVCPTSMPSLSSSPWIRGAPQSGFAMLMPRMSWRMSAGVFGRPPRDRDFQRQ